MAKTEADHAIFWIEEFCIWPDGEHRGLPVNLTAGQRAELKAIYDSGRPPSPAAQGTLAAFVTLRHLLGKPASRGEPRPDVGPVDAWSLWRAAGPELRTYLKREGERVVCVELGTSWPPFAPSPAAA